MLLSEGGGNSLRNLVSLCDACHGSLEGHERRHKRYLLDDELKEIHTEDCIRADESLTCTTDDPPDEYTPCDECRPFESEKRSASERLKAVRAARTPVVKAHLAREHGPMPPDVIEYACQRVPDVMLLRLVHGYRSKRISKWSELETMDGSGNWVAVNSTLLNTGRSAVYLMVSEDDPG